MSTEQDNQDQAEAPRVLLTVEDGIAVATLNRPDVLNAVDEPMREALADMVEHVGKDTSVRALVITGAGRGFCAGGDIRAMRTRLAQPIGTVADVGWRRQRRLHHLVMRLQTLEKVTIAAVNGPAAGLGADLALGCDFIIASQTASFVMSFILRGLVPDGGGMYLLPRRVGLAKAKDLIFTGRRVEAAEALALGMADRLSAPADLLADATAWAAELTQHSPTALGLAKSILNKSFESTLEDTLAAGAQAQAIGYTTAEHRASVEAFLERSDRRARPSTPQE
ncbi:MAG: enoyl-CoA hydratase/isomerase family protein [Chloroflexota bacterium]